MLIKKAITYSLLAHVRNHGTLIKGPLDVFIPLIKRVLSKMNKNGISSGKSLMEIRDIAFELYNIDFPVPVLNQILTAICSEVNSVDNHKIQIYRDGAFSIRQFTFEDYDEIVEQQNNDVMQLEKFFKEFCESSELKINDSESIFKFISKNKFTLSKYLVGNRKTNGEDFTAEAQFVEFFKRIPSIYDIIKNIYLGSIISSYIEYKPDNGYTDLELLLDTNFILGLIDLNTPESTHTCRTLIDIAISNKFKLTILIDTIEEIKNLLNTKALFFDKSFLQRKVNPEDVFNACDRRNLNKVDLEKISDNLEDIIVKFGINIVYNTEKLKNIAKFSTEYKKFEELRTSKKSALHDAIAISYVKQKRSNIGIKEFERVNCWFVNNSTSIMSESIFSVNGFQPETIKVDDLLNILWLSNPQIQNVVNGNDLSEIGLTSLISFTLNKNLPKAQIIKELDDNIHKYSSEGISDKDIVRVATRITNKQLKDIEELNTLAETNKDEFVKRLEKEAENQKRVEEKRIQKLEVLFAEISKKAELMETERRRLEQKNEKIDEIIIEKERSVMNSIELAEELKREKNKLRQVKREKFIKDKISKWRNHSWMWLLLASILLIITLLIILWASEWNFDKAIININSLNNNILITGPLAFILVIFNVFVINNLYNKYCNHSNIQSFKNNLQIPDEFKDIN